MKAMLIEPDRSTPAGVGQAVAKAANSCAPAVTDVLQSSQGGEATADTRGVPTSVGMLLTHHILQDGEVVLLVLKPSLWFILLHSLWFIGGVLLLSFASILLNLPPGWAFWMQAAVFLAAARIMWAVLQWMGRLYILTDMRILRLSGVFNINIFDCPLRKVARTRVIKSMRERLLRLGSIEIIPADGHGAAGVWQTIARPHVIHEQINSAITRAKQGRTPVHV